MQHISTTDFKSQLGQHLASTRDEPLVVQRGGHPIAVVLSPVEYQHLQEFEDLYWLARAEAAESIGEWVSHDEAVQLLAARLGDRT